MKKPGLTGWIVIAMTAGIITGLLIHHSAGIYWSEHFTEYMSIITDIFLRLIKMVPWGFADLVAPGIGYYEHRKPGK
jgi:Na+/H+-dicarboxylate symporter